MLFLRSAAAAACVILPSMSHAFSTPRKSNAMAVGNSELKDEIIVDASATTALSSRRSLLQFTVAAAFASTVVSSEPSYAATDCFSDCLKVVSPPYVFQLLAVKRY